MAARRHRKLAIETQSPSIVHGGHKHAVVFHNTRFRQMASGDSLSSTSRNRGLRRALRALHAQHIVKPYTTYRSLRDVADAFDDQRLCDGTNSFLLALTALGPADSLVDIGAGQGVMARQYLGEVELPRIDRAVEFPSLAQRARVILIDIRKPRETGQWERTANEKLLDRYQYIEAYFETLEGLSPGASSVRLAVDYYGGASYTLRFSEYLRQLLRILQPDAEAYLVFNGVVDDPSRRKVQQQVQRRVESLHESIKDHRLGGLGKEKLNGQDAGKFHNSFVLRQDGSLVFLEEWLEGLEAFDVTHFVSANPFSIPIRLKRREASAFVPNLELVEANHATPPYRLFHETPSLEC